MDAVQSPTQVSAEVETGGGLRRNAVGLTGAVIMSAAIMGPAVSTFFNPQFSTPFSGEATPFVYLVCTVAMLITASGIMEMAREFPSAGAFYTYVTRGLGARAGFVTGALMFVAYALLPPAEIGLIGSFLQSTFQTEFSVNIPWWIIGMVPALLMVFLGFEGIRTSLRTALMLFSVEVFIVLLMAIIVVINGGHSGLTLRPFNPGASPHGFHGLVTGFVFAALSFVGFEGATTLGHEVRDAEAGRPTRRHAQRARRRRALLFLHLGGGRGPRPQGDQRADRVRRSVDVAGVDLRVVDEVAGDHRVGVEHVRRDDQLGQRHLPHPQHDGQGGTCCPSRSGTSIPSG